MELITSNSEAKKQLVEILIRFKSDPESLVSDVVDQILEAGWKYGE